VGEGLGVRGMPLAWIHSRNAALGVVPRRLARPPICVRPLTSDPSPALGRGGSKWIECFARQRASLYSV